MLNAAAIVFALATILPGIPTRGAFSQVQVGPEPNRPFVDVGPVVAPEVTRETDLRQRLQLLADQLDIDGFIVEMRNPMIVYGVRQTGFEGTRDDAYAASGADGAASEAVEALGLKNLRAVYGTKKQIIFLRAYTFARLPADKIAALADNTKKLFKGELQVHDQQQAQRKILEGARDSSITH